MGDFVRLVANTVLGKLDTAPQKTLSRIGQFIRSCRPVFTFDELTGVPKVTIDVAPAEEENTLKEIFEYLGSSEKRCYVAIDEFQQIAEYQEKGVEALLRSYIQFLPNVNIIFAGSKQHLMQEMFTSSKRPFYQSTQLLTIGPVDREAYACFAVGHFAKMACSFPVRFSIRFTINLTDILGISSAFLIACTAIIGMWIRSWWCMLRNRSFPNRAIRMLIC